MDDPSTSERSGTSDINHSVVPILLITGTVLSALACFGKAAVTTDESERFALVVLMIVSAWSGFVLLMRHRSWVRSLREQAEHPSG